MKRILFIIVLLNFVSNSFAQTHIIGEKQIALNFATNNTGSLFFKYYSNEKYCHRYGLHGHYAYSNKFKHPSPGYKYDYYSFSYSAGISYGLQKSFSISEKVEPYIGFDLIAKSDYATSYINEVVIDTSVVKNSRIGDYNSSISIDPHNLGLIFRPLIGISVYLAKNLSLGAEYQIPVLSFTYYLPDKITFTDGSGKTTEFTNGDTFEFKTGVSGSGSFLVSYYF